MASFFIQLADAVVSALNEHDFSRKFTAERIYDPHRQLETLETLRVDVILGDRNQVPLDRSRQKNDCRIEIAVRQVIKAVEGSDEEQKELDALVEFLEEIDSYLNDPANRRLPQATWAGWQGSQLVYPYLPGHLRSNRQFTSLLRQNYFVATT